MIEKLFRGATLPIAAGATLMFSVVSPAVAEDASMTRVSASTAVEESFPQADLSMHPPSVIESWVKRGCPDTKTQTNKCEDRVTLVSYGGEDGYGDAVLRAAERLDRERIPVAFVRAADNNADDSNAVVIAYASGERRDGITSSSELSYIDADFAERNNTEQKAYEMGRDVYNSELKPLVLSAR